MAKKKKILLVEDDVFVCDVYQTKLNQEKFEVILAENGIKAIEKLKKDVPDLVLLDIVMPYMDGREVLEKMKADDRLKDIPIIILTNLSQKDEVEELMEKGADDYLIKSHFTPSEVSRKIKNLLEK